MNNYTLVIVDTAQIQPYIFASNRLRENIGASFLVSEATSTWAFEAIKKIAMPANFTGTDKEYTLDDRSLENDQDLQTEVIYSGGGNFVVLFRDDLKAAAFSRALTRDVLIKAPGLQLILARKSFSWQVGSLQTAVKEVFDLLEQKKRSGARSLPLLGLSVTETCRSTGLPAVGMTNAIGSQENSFPASAQIIAKHSAVEDANSRLKNNFANVLLAAKDQIGAETRFPHDFDKLGRSREDFSYIAIVHADGNGVGKRIVDFGQSDALQANVTYIAKMREFSRKLATASHAALQSALQQLVLAIDPNSKSIRHENENGQVISQVHLCDEQPEDTYFLPVRPLVYGGDDMTLVCDGRLALSLAECYMQAFQQATAEADLPDGLGAATACAGISIVKSHYPFSRAYTLAEDLCANAKTYRRELRLSYPDPISCLDWHFAASGLFGSIEDIRAKEYTTPEGCLTLRPLLLDEDPLQVEYRTWAVMKKLVAEFQGPSWFDRRSKLKALRDALRQGPAAVEAFGEKYLRNPSSNEIIKLPAVGTASSDFQNKGWADRKCGYFDAIELMDWFIPLSEIKEKRAQHA